MHNSTNPKQGRDGLTAAAGELDSDTPGDWKGDIEKPGSRVAPRAAALTMLGCA